MPGPGLGNFKDPALKLPMKGRGGLSARGELQPLQVDPMAAQGGGLSKYAQSADMARFVNDYARFVMGKAPAPARPVDPAIASQLGIRNADTTGQRFSTLAAYEPPGTEALADELDRDSWNIPGMPLSVSSLNSPGQPLMSIKSEYYRRTPPPISGGSDAPMNLSDFAKSAQFNKMINDYARFVMGKAPAPTRPVDPNILRSITNSNQLRNYFPQDDYLVQGHLDDLDMMGHYPRARDEWIYGLHGNPSISMPMINTQPEGVEGGSIGPIFNVKEEVWHKRFK